MTAGDELVRAQMIALLPRLHRFALLLTSSRADADDLVQATCERAIARLDGWARGTSSTAGCSRSRTTCTAITGAIRPIVCASCTEHGQTQDISMTVRGARRLWTELQEVRVKVQALPEEQRIVLMLVAIEGLAYREVADLLEVPVGTVTSRLARARDALRAAFTRVIRGERELELA